jgi:phage terminase small subunit
MRAKDKPQPPKLDAARRQRVLFARAYLTNGFNSHRAALAAGFAPKWANTKGSTLLRDPYVKLLLEEGSRRAAVRAELTVERMLREVMDVAFVDPRKFYRDNGTLVPPSEWDDAMAAAVSSFQVTELWSGKGDDRHLAGHTTKVKFWPKLEASDKLMKHLGLFERDNRQRQENIAIQVNLVGPDPVTGRQTVVKANLLEGRRV